MVGVYGGRRVDLEAVVVVVGILEEAVHWVEHIVRHMEKPLPSKEFQSQLHFSPHLKFAIGIASFQMKNSTLA